jgi:nitrogen fixation protein FixH
MRIDAGLRWILIVLALLVGNVLAVVLLITAAGPASADRVVPDYYERAAAFDRELAAERDSAELGWVTDVQIGGGAIEVKLYDRAGTPVVGARLEVTGHHRAHAATSSTVAPAEVTPGTYRAALTATPGLWDVTVRGARGHESHVAHTTVEAR